MNIIFYAIHDPEFKGVIHVPSSKLHTYASLSTGMILSRLLSERFYLGMSGMIFPRNHRFFEMFDKKFQQLVTAGIIDHMNKPYFEYTSWNYYKHKYPVGPKVLTMEHLEAGFKVWLVSLSFAFGAFFIEWINTLMTYFVVKSMFKAFYKTKQIKGRKQLQQKVIKTFRKASSAHSSKRVSTLLSRSSGGQRARAFSSASLDSLENEINKVLEHFKRF